MTTYQIQCLLAYLGYKVTPDGKYGPQTTKTVKDFQAEYNDELSVDGDAGIMTQAALVEAVAQGWERPDTLWAEIKHFKREEFRCKCGKYCNGFPAEMDGKLVMLADMVRDHFGAEMIVSSGIRCERHNANVGGVSNSRHLSGKAMDFSISGFSADMVLPYVQKLSGIRYAYAIDRNYVHMDVE